MQTAAGLLGGLLSLYSLAIVIRIVLSWGGMGELRFGSFYRILKQVTDPYLNLFRNIPGLQRGNLDFSPIIAMIIIGIVNNVLSIFAAQGKITFGIILALISNAAWSVISFFLFLFIIIAVFRVFLEYRPTANSIQYIAILDNLLRGPVDRIHRLIFGGKETATKTLLLTTAGTFILLRIVLKVGFNWLADLLVGLPF